MSTITGRNNFRSVVQLLRKNCKVGIIVQWAKMIYANIPLYTKRFFFFGKKSKGFQLPGIWLQSGIS